MAGIRTDADRKLECLRAAISLATTKIIKPGDVVGYAMEFHRWVDGSGSARDLKVDDDALVKLQQRFRK